MSKTMTATTPNECGASQTAKHLTKVTHSPFTHMDVCEVDPTACTCDEKVEVVITREERLAVQRKALERQVVMAQEQLAKHGGQPVRETCDYKRTLSTILMIDVTDDADSEEVKQIIELAKKRKRTQLEMDDGKTKRRVPHSKKAKSRSSGPPRVFVNSGNADVLRALGVGVGRVGDVGMASVQLPAGWTSEWRTDWDGTMDGAWELRNQKGEFVCELAHKVIRDDVVVL